MSDGPVPKNLLPSEQGPRISLVRRPPFGAHAHGIGSRDSEIPSPPLNLRRDSSLVSRGDSCPYGISIAIDVKYSD